MAKKHKDQNNRNPYPKGTAKWDIWNDEHTSEDLAKRFAPSDKGAYQYTDPYQSAGSLAQRDAFGFAAGIYPLTGKPTGAYGGDQADNLKDVISKMKSGLEGYAAPELQAFREKAQSGIDTSYYTRLRELKSAQATSNVRGASALAQQNNLLRGRNSDQQQLEQDLFVKNADARQARLKDYSAEVESQRAGQADAIGAMSGWQTKTNASDAATQGANIQEKWKEKSFQGSMTAAQQALLNAQRNQNKSWKFLNDHPEAYSSGGGGGANAGMASGIADLIAQQKALMAEHTSNALPPEPTTGFA